MPKKTISIRDIARMAGVSTATVSKVLSGKGSISQVTRERVEEIARREGYIANYAAKTLRKSRTCTIGIVTPDVSNDFFSSIVLGFETVLYDNGYVCYICNTRGNAEREEDYLRSITQRQIDGLVFVGGRHAIDWSLIPSGTPVVCIDCPFGLRHEGVVYVENDWEGIVRDSVQTLLKRGARRIAYLSVTGAHVAPEENPLFMTYAKTLSEADIILDRNLMLQGSHRKASMLEAGELVGRCLDDGWTFDGVFAIGDRVALGAIAVLGERGIKVGSDVLVMGVDDSPGSRIVKPTLSSVNRHVDELASVGAEALLSMISGGTSPQRIVIPHEIVERESTQGAEGRGAPVPSPAPSKRTR